ncbi:MAG: hypothetical protein A2293_06955 [Elusimicrobia bacterium RIFOXYB2_FULL_49_7]|nr:MAG: hypothetical protein A2293_06955 [Elusimicrobia bacterium RIFOXYB2_FULL_49_7]
MVKSFLFIAMTALAGMAFGRLFYREMGKRFLLLSAFAVGTALFGCLATLLFASGSVWALMRLVPIWFVSAIILALLSLYRKPPQRINLNHGVVTMVITVSFAFFFYKLAVIAMTTDSFVLARLGQNLGFGRRDGGSALFSMWGPVIPLLQATAGGLGRYLFFEYQPLLGLSLLFLFADRLWVALKGNPLKTRLTIILLSLLALTLSPIFLHHFFYLHANLAAGLYLFLFITLSGSYVENKKQFFLWPALLSLLTFSLICIEGTFFALLFLSYFIGKSHPDARRRVSMALVPLLLGLWFIRLAFVIPTPHDWLSPVLAFEMGMGCLFYTVVLVLFSFTKSAQQVERLIRKLPWILAGALVISFIVKPLLQWHSLLALLTALFFTGEWGLVWYVIFAAIGWVFWQKIGKTETHYLGPCIVMYGCGLMLISPWMGGYDASSTGWANRLMFQIFPTLVFYLAVSMGKREPS